MLCPRDNSELKVSARQGVEFDYCPQCRGVWLDRGELEKLIEETVKEADVYPQGAGFPPPAPGPDSYNYPGTPPPPPGYYPPQGGYYPERGGGKHGGGEHGGGEHGGGKHGGGYSNPYPRDNNQGRKRKSFLSDIFDF